MFKRLIITLSILLMTSFVAFALDDQGNPNDPNENDRANACYEDGSMADKCKTDWEWECGWHLIQFEYDLTTREDFPTWCISIIPPEILPEPLEELEELMPVVNAPTTPSAGCITLGGINFDFNGGYFQAGSHAHFTDATCTLAGIIHVKIDIVYSPAGFDPLALCNLNGVYTSVSAEVTDIYRCNP